MKKEDCKIGTVVIAKSKTNINNMYFTYEEFLRFSPLGVGKIAASMYAELDIIAVEVKKGNRHVNFAFRPEDLIKVE